MYNEKYHKNENLECCKKLKDCVKSLILLANIAGFIMLCILVKFSSDDDLDDCETILGLSIALLSVLCSYMFLSIVFFFLCKKGENRLESCLYHSFATMDSSLCSFCYFNHRIVTANIAN